MALEFEKELGVCPKQEAGTICYQHHSLCMGNPK
jgi:hypothetical protein